MVLGTKLKECLTAILDAMDKLTHIGCVGAGQSGPSTPGQTTQARAKLDSFLSDKHFIEPKG